MPRPSQPLIDALETTARRLQGDAHYEWGHVGHCNCGHLVQSVCELSPRKIYERFGNELGEWTEHATDRCGQTGMEVDTLLAELRALGFDREDVGHLENLSDREVLRRLPEGRRHLRRNEREDVVVYLSAMAGMLEERLVVS